MKRMLKLSKDFLNGKIDVAQYQSRMMVALFEAKGPDLWQLAKLMFEEGFPYTVGLPDGEKDAKTHNSDKD